MLTTTGLLVVVVVVVMKFLLSLVEHRLTYLDGLYLVSAALNSSSLMIVGLHACTNEN